MKVAISGITGFIGRNLRSLLILNDYDIIALTRDDFQKSSVQQLTKKLEGCDAIVNLAGAPVSVRWNKKNKEKIYKSRIHTTQLLVSAVNALSQKPAVFISTSAVGIYSLEGVHTEESIHYDDSFLSKVCQDWELEITKLNPTIRSVIFRLGLVLGADGGILPRLLKPIKIGILPIFGDGKQPFPWVYVDDLVHLIEKAIVDDQMKGVYNCVAPELITQKEVAESFSPFFKPKFQLTFPHNLLKFFLKNGASVLTQGQLVKSIRVEKIPFEFQYPHLLDALTSSIV